MPIIYIQLFAITCLLLILFLGITRYSSKRNQSLLFFILLIGSTILWGIGVVGFSNLKEYNQVLFFSKFSFLAASLIPSLMLSFALAFNSGTKAISLKNIVLIFFPSITLAGFSIFSGLIVRDVVVESNIVEYGPLYFLIAVQLFTYSVISIILFYKKSRIKDLPGTQARYLFISYGLSLLTGIFINIILPNLIHSSKYSGLGFLSTIFAILGMYYVTRRYRFLDIRYLFSKILFTLISGVFIFCIFFLVAFGLIRTMGTLFTPGSYIAGAVIALVFVLYYPKIRSSLQFLIDKELVKGEYDRDEIMDRLNKRIRNELNLKQLLHIILSTLEESGITKGGFFLILEDKKHPSEVSIHKIQMGNRECLDIDPDIVAYLQRTESIILRDEIYQVVAEKSNKNLSFLTEVYEYLKSNDISIIIPINQKDKLIGLMALREKISESPFNIRDIDFFVQIRTSSSIAVQRAILYKESQQFALTLQHKIDEATHELKQAYEELKRVDAQKDDFISIAGHELRTPAAIIKTSLWMLQRYGIATKEKEIKKIVDAQEANERLIRLIDDFLTTSRLDRSKYHFEITKIDIADLISQVIEDNKGLFEDKRLSIEFFKPKKPIFVEADRDKIIEVITNLLSNASKYTERGGITVNLTDDDQDNVIISIKDTGYGITKEQMNKLFKKFSRLEHSFSKTAKIRGTGLGLYISKQIVTQHNGTITAKSKGKGAGSTFTVTLPKKFSGQKGQENEEKIESLEQE